MNSVPGHCWVRQRRSQTSNSHLNSPWWFSECSLLWCALAKSDTTGKTPSSYQILQELRKWSPYRTRLFGIVLAEQVIFCFLKIPESLLSPWMRADTAALTKRLTAVIHTEVFPAGVDCKHWKNAGGLFRQKGYCFCLFVFSSDMFFLWRAQLFLSLLVCWSCWRFISNLREKIL